MHLYEKILDKIHEKQRIDVQITQNRHNRNLIEIIELIIYVARGGICSMLSSVVRIVIK